MNIVLGKYHIFPSSSVSALLLLFYTSEYTEITINALSWKSEFKMHQTK